MNPKLGVPDACARMDSHRGATPIHVAVPITMSWLWSPVGLLLLLPAPALIGSITVSDDTFLRLFGQPIFTTTMLREVAMGYFLLLIAIVAIFVPSSARAKASIRLDFRQQVWLDRAVRILTLVTLAAYFVWLAAAVAKGLRPTAIAGLLQGDADMMYVLRSEYLSTMGGVTTWMQVGALAAPLAVLRSRAGIRPARTVITGLVLLSFIRALLNSERLALFEILLSVILANLILRPEVPALLRRKLVVAGLIVASWISLLLTFGAFEYFRSWSNYRDSYEGGFWAYVYNLLLGYYATALNNASFDAFLLKGESVPRLLFDGNFYEWLLGASPIAGAQHAYGLEIYTNRSGLLAPFTAFGLVGGGLAVLTMATFMAMLARRTAAGSVVAFAVYCASAIGLLEVVRLFYFGSSRFLPVVLAGVVLVASWHLASPRGSRQIPRRGASADLRGSSGVVLQ